MAECCPQCVRLCKRNPHQLTTQVSQTMGTNMHLRGIDVALCSPPSSRRNRSSSVAMCLVHAFRNATRDPGKAKDRLPRRTGSCLVIHTGAGFVASETACASWTATVAPGLAIAAAYTSQMNALPLNRRCRQCGRFGRRHLVHLCFLARLRTRLSRLVGRSAQANARPQTAE